MITITSMMNLFVLALAAYGAYTTLVRKRRRVPVEPRSTRKSELTQSWIDEERTDERVVRGEPESQVIPEPPRAGTGRTANVSSGGRLLRLEEFVIGDRYVTRVTKINRQGHARGLLSEMSGKLEDVAKQIA